MSPEIAAVGKARAASQALIALSWDLAGEAGLQIGFLSALRMLNSAV
jgi:hypothetical protein